MNEEESNLREVQQAMDEMGIESLTCERCGADTDMLDPVEPITEAEEPGPVRVCEDCTESSEEPTTGLDELLEPRDLDEFDTDTFAFEYSDIEAMLADGKVMQVPNGGDILLVEADRVPADYRDEVHVRTRHVPRNVHLDIKYHCVEHEDCDLNDPEGITIPSLEALFDIALREFWSVEYPPENGHRHVVKCTTPGIFNQEPSTEVLDQDELERVVEEYHLDSFEPRGDER